MCGSITKRHLSRSTVVGVVRAAIPDCSVRGVCELTEGYFNAAYAVDCDGGRRCIVKVAPSPDTPVMSYEHDLMSVEISTMRTIARLTDIPVPRVLFQDDRGKLCGSPLFVMTRMPGASLSSLRGRGLVDDADHARILHDIGTYNARINSIHPALFGYPALRTTWSNSWHAAFSTMLGMALGDAGRVNCDLGLDAGRLLTALSREGPIFNQVRRPSLVHWDLWDGNIFVDGGRISGIIDWERSLWADPLMEVGFRRHCRDDAFMKGYGMSRPTADEERRSLWYDIYMMILLAQEGEYGHYAEDSIRRWAMPILQDRVDELSR